MAEIAGLQATATVYNRAQGLQRWLVLRTLMLTGKLHPYGR